MDYDEQAEIWAYSEQMVEKFGEDWREILEDRKEQAAIDEWEGE